MAGIRSRLVNVVLLGAVTGAALWWYTDEIKAQILAGIQAKLDSLVAELDRRNKAAVNDAVAAHKTRLKTWEDEKSRIQKDYEERRPKECVRGTTATCTALENDRLRKLAKAASDALTQGEAK
jgi:hypothetical protein